MALTRSVLVTTPEDREVPVEYRMSDHPFKLRIGSSEYRLTYLELQKILTDGEGEIRDWLGYPDKLEVEEHV